MVNRFVTARLARLWISGLLVGAALVMPASAQGTTFVLKWASLTANVTPGSYATAAVTTTATARCGIVVKYASSVSSAKGLVTKIAPANGKLSWTWKVGTNTHAGSWRVTITCKLGTKTLSIWRTMTVR